MERLTARQAATILGISHSTICRKHETCDLVGEGLGAIEGKTPKGRDGLTFSPEIIDQAKAKLQEVERGEWVNVIPITVGADTIEPGETWQRSDKFADDVSKATGIEARLLTRGLLRAVKLRRITGKDDFEFFQKNGNAWILKSEQARVIANHRAAKGDKKTTVLFPRAMALFDGVFPGEPEAYSVKRAAAILTDRLKRISVEGYGENWLTNMVVGVRGRKFDRKAEMPEWLAATFPQGIGELRLLPIPDTVEEIAAISKPELDRLYDAIRARVRAQRAKKPGTIDRQEVFQRHKIKTALEVMQVNKFLDSLPKQTIPSKGKPKALWQEADLEAKLAGRPLIDVAREHWQQHLSTTDLGKAILAQLNGTAQPAPNIREAVGNPNKEIFRETVRALEKTGAIEVSKTRLKADAKNPPSAVLLLRVKGNQEAGQPKRRGRKRARDTWELYRWVYEQYKVEDLGRATVKRAMEKRLKRREGSLAGSMVTTYCDYFQASLDEAGVILDGKTKPEKLKAIAEHFEKMTFG